MPTTANKEQTEAELLQKILGEIGEAMAAPDADTQFLMAIQQAIVQHIAQKKQQGQQAIQQAATMGGMGGGEGGEANPGMGSPLPPNVSGLPGRAGPPGLSTLTDTDELRRMLAGSPAG